MADIILTAEVAQVSIGCNIQIEGLKLDDLENPYAITVQQIAKLFSVPQNNAQRYVESLLGKDVQFLKIQVKNAGRQNRPVNAIRIIDFQKLLFELLLRGNEQAVMLSRALIGLSLEQLFADAFNVTLTKSDRQSAIDRILNTPEPWERMYSKQMCSRAFGWFGGNFYHAFCYQWMTVEEKCKQDNLNPIINGARKYKIHQFIEPETKEKLHPYVAELCALIMAASSKQMFITLYQNRFGAGWQQEIFV